MFIFYKNYGKTSTLATILSCIGGAFYLGAVAAIIAAITGQETFGEMFMLALICAVSGFGLNKLAEKIAKEKIASKNQNSTNAENNNGSNNGTSKTGNIVIALFVIAVISIIVFSLSMNSNTDNTNSSAETNDSSSLEADIDSNRLSSITDALTPARAYEYTEKQSGSLHYSVPETYQLDPTNSFYQYNIDDTLYCIFLVTNVDIVENLNDDNYLLVSRDLLCENTSDTLNDTVHTETVGANEWKTLKVSAAFPEDPTIINDYYLYAIEHDGKIYSFYFNVVHTSDTTPELNKTFFEGIKNSLRFE